MNINSSKKTQILASFKIDFKFMTLLFDVKKIMTSTPRVVKMHFSHNVKTLANEQLIKTCLARHVLLFHFHSTCETDEKQVGSHYTKRRLLNSRVTN